MMHLYLGHSASPLCVELTCALKHLLTESYEPGIQWQEKNYFGFMQNEIFAFSGKLLSWLLSASCPTYAKKSQGEVMSLRELHLRSCHAWMLLGVLLGFSNNLFLIKSLLQIFLNQKKNSSSIDLRSKIILASFPSATGYPHVSKGMLSYSPGISTSASGVCQSFWWSVPRSKLSSVQKVQKDLSFFPPCFQLL